MSVSENCFEEPLFNSVDDDCLLDATDADQLLQQIADRHIDYHQNNDRIFAGNHQTEDRTVNNHQIDVKAPGSNQFELLEPLFGFDEFSYALETEGISDLFDASVELLTFTT